MSLSEGIELIKEFVAPGDDPASIRKWRGLMSIFIFILGFHMIWSCGYLERWGAPGFATSADISRINVKLDDHGRQLDVIGVQALERAIIETRQAECESSKKAFFTQRLADLEGQYSTLMKHNFAVPDCKDMQ